MASLPSLKGNLTVGRTDIYNENQKMHLWQLPHEVLTHILGYLDIRSQLRAWEVCAEFRPAMRYRKFVRRVNLRYWRVPRATHDFLCDNALHIEELNLSCVKGLSEELAVSALRRLENLRSLDVTHTAVTLRGASAVCAACPHLVRLACNFTPLGAKTRSVASFLAVEVDSFENLEFVHFVANPLTSVDPFDVLSCCRNLKEFKLTSGELSVKLCKYLKCWKKATRRHPTLRSLSCHIINLYHNNLVIRPRDCFNVAEWEFFISKHGTSQVYLSRKMYEDAIQGPAITASFTHHNLEIRELNPFEDFEMSTRGTVDLYAWHADLVQLNPGLYKSVVEELRLKSPVTFCRSCDLMESYRTNNISLYTLCKCTFKKPRHERDARGLDMSVGEFLPSDRDISIDYDSMGNCVLILGKYTCNTILSCNFPVLRNLVHLSLWESDFRPATFEVMFQQCVKLNTLNIYTEHCGSIRALHHSKSIRNVCFCGTMKKGLNSVLRSLAECPTLENVHIYDSNGVHFEPNEKVFDAFFEGCPELCSLHLHCKILPKAERNLREIVQKLTSQKNRADTNFTYTKQTYENDDCDELYVMTLYLPCRPLHSMVDISDLEVNRNMIYPAPD